MMKYDHETPENGDCLNHRLARRLRRQHYRLAEVEKTPAALAPLTKSATGAKHGAAVLEAEKMVDHLREQLARTQAEFDNYRKRQRREEQQRNELANLQLIDQLLPVLDNYDRALKNPGDNVQSLLSGIEMVHKQFADTLRQVGLEKIEPLGQPFDPNLHEAVSAVPAVEGQSDNTVVEVFQDGYVLNGRLIRPAMVQVTRT